MKHKVSPLEKTLNTWAIILIIWSIYRTKFSLPIWADEFVAKPLIFLLPVYIYIKREEAGAILQNIWFKTKNLAGDISMSILIGVFFAATILFARFVQSGGAVQSETLQENGILLTLLIILATAVSEEVLSRGFVLKRLFESSHNIYSSSFLGSILFVIMHIPIIMTNYNLSGSLILIFLSTEFFLSLVNSFVFLDRKSLLPVILIHAFYNLAIIMYV